MGTELDTLLSELTEIEAGVLTALTVVSVILALMQCFFGYRLLRFWVTLIGGLAGFALGFGISRAQMQDAQVWIPVLIGVVAAALLGFLAFKIYLAGVFLLCGILAGAAVLTIPFPDESVWKTIRIILAIAAFIIAGILSVKFNRQVVIIVTAFSGGMQAADGIAKLAPELSANEAYPVMLGAVLVIAGLAIQFLTTRKYARRRK